MLRSGNGWLSSTILAECGIKHERPVSHMSISSRDANVSTSVLLSLFVSCISISSALTFFSLVITSLPCSSSFFFDFHRIDVKSSPSQIHRSIVLRNAFFLTTFVPLKISTTQSSTDLPVTLDNLSISLCSFESPAFTFLGSSSTWENKSASAFSPSSPSYSLTTLTHESPDKRPFSLARPARPPRSPCSGLSLSELTSRTNASSNSSTTSSITSVTSTSSSMFAIHELMNTQRTL
mmetsp:Transcript_8180/g.14575  ORF Transcript_8180/g.14575 Transcript_8180/m.14575 type:complete len:236 (+) Transcript_8180:1234-1941(+)